MREHFLRLMALVMTSLLCSAYSFKNWSAEKIEEYLAENFPPGTHVDTIENFIRKQDVYSHGKYDDKDGKQYEVYVRDRSSGDILFLRGVAVSFYFDNNWKLTYFKVKKFLTGL